jgi:hypothetical protein
MKDTEIQKEYSSLNRVAVIVFNTTFNNISVISWRSVLLVEETCIMMVIDGCIYLVIGWYVRNVKPGKYTLLI